MTIDHIRALPCWQGDITAEPLSGGLSNESWKVRDGQGMHVVRFGTDFPFHHVSREREGMTARAAHAAGFAPKVRYSAPGVMVSAFLEARTWEPADVRQSPERVGTLLRQFHHKMAEEVSGPAFLFWVFHVIRDYARTLRANESRHIPQLQSYLALAAEFETAQVPLPIVFGHHDLLPANILDDGDKLWLIDFEYAGFGTAMFDLAGAASNAGMSDGEAMRMLNSYFGVQPDAKTLRAFDAMQCASLLREAMWSMVSEIFLNAPGADYAAYTKENLEMFDAALTRYRQKYGTKS
ncbi:MAG: phosphotransferase [Paracoccaceae bacterium]|nr:phosphotransferase [Paracoccaceae bacterium]MDH5529772.1 phosphotransferase [Paracoccaceae bacterium]